MNIYISTDACYKLLGDSLSYNSLNMLPIVSRLNSSITVRKRRKKNLFFPFALCVFFQGFIGIRTINILFLSLLISCLLQYLLERVICSDFAGLVEA